MTESSGNNGKNYSSGVPTVLPPAFRNDFPEVVEVTFTSYQANAVVLVHEKNQEPRKFAEIDGVTYAEPSFFKIFDRTFAFGDNEKSLDEPNEAVISRRLAVKYFGREDARGEVLTFGKNDYTIRAVMEDIAQNTDFPFDLMLSYVTVESELEKTGWNTIGSFDQCFILTENDADRFKIQERIPAFTEKHNGKANLNKSAFFLQALGDVHFDSRFDNYSRTVSSKPMLTALGLVALFLILTACINFVNLSTAEAVKRSKEVGIRKSLGSRRSQLVGQFLGETFLVTVIAVVAALTFVQLGLSFLNGFLGTKLVVAFASDRLLWIFLFGVTALVSLCSGLYPSFVISAFNPIDALKNRINIKSSSAYMLRRSLVVFQFVVAQVFIMGTLILINQMDFFMSRDLGFEREAIISVPIPETEIPQSQGGNGKMKTLRQEVASLPGVVMASIDDGAPSSSNISKTGFYLKGNDERIPTQIKSVDDNYITLFGLTLLAGNNVADRDTATGCLVNEQLVKAVGVSSPEEMIGHEIKVVGKWVPVVGVLKDFHTMSLHKAIDPVILLKRIKTDNNLSVKVKGNNLHESIETIRQKWEVTYPNSIFAYSFLDEQISEFYTSDRKLSTILTISTGLAIFIGCLGLLGLATFMANEKTKEIGLRKVLGASVANIVFLFSNEFGRLILLGFVIAVPFAWYIMNEWLNGFAYRIEISPFVFVVALGITLVVAMLTVGYRSFRAAMVNPVKSLRSGVRPFGKTNVAKQKMSKTLNSMPSLPPPTTYHPCLQ